MVFWHISNTPQWFRTAAITVFANTKWPLNASMINSHIDMTLVFFSFFHLWQLFCWMVGRRQCITEGGVIIVCHSMCDDNSYSSSLWLEFHIPEGRSLWPHWCVRKPQNSAFNTLKPRQNGRHFPDDIFKCIFVNENIWISIKTSLKFVPEGPINNIPSLVQIMDWRRPGDKPLSEPMTVKLSTHICVNRPQWVNGTYCPTALPGLLFWYPDM